jgi:NAD(P)-dependent dehydrogenase (short-subunit alcohol dehydrogenase family)
MIQPGLRVLVTGGASGIGWAIAVALQQQAARLHLCDASPERLSQALRQQPEMSGSVADVGDARQVDLHQDEMESRYLEQVSLRRMVTHADVAAMALFLCSPASRNISGQSLGVCGNVEFLR